MPGDPRVGKTREHLTEHASHVQASPIRVTPPRDGDSWHVTLCVVFTIRGRKDVIDHADVLNAIASPLPPSSLPALGDTPSFEQLTSWFDTLLSVQRSAVGSDAFYDETAMALVELIGLDRGLVLLRTTTGWRIVAGTSRDDHHGLDYSTSIVERVAAEARTYSPIRVDRTSARALPISKRLSAHPSSVRIEMSSGSCMGRETWIRNNPRVPRHLIRPLDAQLVQVLANSVSSGLVRTAILSD